MDWKACIDRLGISICPNSSVAIAGAMKLRHDNIIKEKDEVVVILTAHGSKFSKTTVEYHDNTNNQYANLTSTIEADIDQLERILNL